MTNEEYLSSWKQLLWVELKEYAPQRLTTLPDFGVIIPNNVVESIKSQLMDLKGKDCVYFIPGANDWDLMGYPKKCDGYIGDIIYDPSTRILPDNQIVGSLFDVSETDDIHTNKHLYVKVNIVNKLKNILPFRGYELHVGFDSNFTTWEETQIEYNHYKRNVIKSCVVKGVYWKESSNHNHRFGKCSMAPYYNQRLLNLYVYEPGRYYW